MHAMNKYPVQVAASVAASLSLLTGSIRAAESPAPLRKEKLQIVFCFGQSNMVGLAAVPTAWHLTHEGIESSTQGPLSIGYGGGKSGIPQLRAEKISSAFHRRSLAALPTRKPIPRKPCSSSARAGQVFQRPSSQKQIPGNPATFTAPTPELPQPALRGAEIRAPFAPVIH